MGAEMLKISGLKVAGVTLAASMLWMAPAASAQTIKLVCEINGSELSTLMDEHVERFDGQLATWNLSLDFDEGTFDLQSTSGYFTESGDLIVMMARSGKMLGLWEIDRKTGDLKAFGALNDEAESVMLIQHGQCTKNGKTPF